jgi:O-acetylhomoserine/O-acetylserine sulfhydrylase-like pyridoxal-dependent enzyme
MNKFTGATVVAATLTAGILSFPQAATAGGDVVRTGTCSGNSTTKIKAKFRDGGIEAEFEVDQNRNGVTWRVRIKQDGDLVWHGTRTTRAPSGSFSVDRRLRNTAGSDTIVGRAVNPNTGEVCHARVVLG